MPELPEVETTRRGITPHALGERVTGVVVRDSRLRWPVPLELQTQLPGSQIESIRRRGKYILIATDTGTLIVHLGMSGSLRVLESDAAPGKHDHVDLQLGNGRILRYNDPRRFGCMLWTLDDPGQEHFFDGTTRQTATFTVTVFHKADAGPDAVAGIVDSVVDQLNDVQVAVAGHDRGVLTTLSRGAAQPDGDYLRADSTFQIVATTSS